MINLKKIFLILIIGVSSICGTEITIDEQIKTISQASAPDRVRLMNELKIRIATMNEEQRTETLQTLQLKMSGSARQSGQQSFNMRYSQMQQTGSSRQNEMMKQNQIISPIMKMPQGRGR